MFYVVAHLHYHDDPDTGISREWSKHPTFGGACEAANRYARTPVSMGYDAGALIDSLTVHDSSGKRVYSVSPLEDFV